MCKIKQKVPIFFLLLFISIFRATVLGNILECPTSNPAELEACLQRVNASQLAIAQFGVLTQLGTSGYPFLPVVDGKFLTDNPQVGDDSHLLYNNIHNYCRTSLYFLPLQNLVKTALKKEILLGLNKDEGSYFMAYGLPGFDLGEDLLTHQQFLGALTQFIGVNAMVGNVISLMYVSIIDSSPGKYRDALKNVLSDVLFFCPVTKFAKR